MIFTGDDGTYAFSTSNVISGNEVLRTIGDKQSESVLELSETELS
jgi:hypothetical protein